MCQVLFPSQRAPCLLAWLLQQNWLGSGYFNKKSSPLTELLSDGVCRTSFYFPIAVKTCWSISIKFENIRKRSSPPAVWRKKSFQILSVNFLSMECLAWTMEHNDCFHRHTKPGPDYHHQFSTKNYHKTGSWDILKRIHYRLLAREVSTRFPQWIQMLPLILKWQFNPFFILEESWRKLQCESR